MPFTGTCLVHRAELMQLQRRLGGRAGGGARRGRALRAAPNDAAAGAGVLPAGGDPSSPGRVRGGRAGLPRGEPARVASRSRGWRCCDWRRADRRCRGRDPPGGGEASERLERGGLLPACVEIMLAAGDVERRGAPPTSSRRSPRELERADAARDGRARPRARSRWPRASPGAPSSRCAALAAVAGARGAVRGRAGARPRRARLPGARRRGDGRDWSWRRRAPCSSELGAAPDVARVDALSAAGRRADAGRADARASSRCCAWSPPGRPTRR